MPPPAGGLCGSSVEQPSRRKCPCIIPSFIDIHSSTSVWYGGIHVGGYYEVAETDKVERLCTDAVHASAACWRAKGVGRHQGIQHHAHQVQELKPFKETLFRGHGF
jgi:hypothetical protein